MPAKQNGKQIPGRDIDEIIEDMRNLIMSPLIEKDRHGLEKYIQFYKEYLTALGIKTHETWCPFCNKKIDEPENEKYVKLLFEDNIFKVLYACPDCAVFQPLGTTLPEGDSLHN